MSRRLALPGALVIAAAAAITAGPAAVASSTRADQGPASSRPTSNPVRTASRPSAGVQDCLDLFSAARKKDTSAAEEPDVTRGSGARAYGVLKSFPQLAPGSVTVPVVFHVTSDHLLTDAERARYERMIAAQMDVMNASYSGATGGADTPFRWRLAGIDYTVNPAWYTVVPGKTEKAMKAALHTGDSRTLNVYTGDIGDGLLGWAYFPKDYNNGRDYLDGVVMLDESMPGGTAGKYALGDTLVHEAGHWLALYHTFQGGCTWSNDFVADTPAEAHPQFDCPVGADSCDAPGLDPIHNFMDYTQDSCMDSFTPGQAKRMSDAWQYLRDPVKG
ncbi:zinc metalloprotease [Arsenicicoccus sp. MKL-02]|uniref:Zinc metalloprotease n=1 Tax=Arsenicicoccus cauae TaxID=2663847 RepID=A0A6I3IFW0_9MICO|nr:zinc metalloprotease [Arsenicicoccus cauae]MTB72932.1 zinc metalloprotease [Arsenicicoccus cauae]